MTASRRRIAAAAATLRAIAGVVEALVELAVVVAGARGEGSGRDPA